MAWTFANQGVTFATGWSYQGGGYTPPDYTTSNASGTFSLTLPSSPHQFVDVDIVRRNTLTDAKTVTNAFSNLEVWVGFSIIVNGIANTEIAEVIVYDHASPSTVYFDWIYEQLSPSRGWVVGAMAMN